MWSKQSCPRNDAGGLPPAAKCLRHHHHHSDQLQRHQQEPMAFNLSSAGITRCSNVSSNHPTSRPLTFSDSLDLRPDVAVAVNANATQIAPQSQSHVLYIPGKGKCRLCNTVYDRYCCHICRVISQGFLFPLYHDGIDNKVISTLWLRKRCKFSLSPKGADILRCPWGMHQLCRGCWRFIQRADGGVHVQLLSP